MSFLMYRIMFQQKRGHVNRIKLGNKKMVDNDFKIDLIIFHLMRMIYK